MKQVPPVLRRNSAIILLFATFLVVPVSAQEALTLPLCLEKVRTENRALKAAATRVEASRLRASRADVLPDPVLSAEMENWGGRGDSSGTRAMESTLALSQLVETGGKRQARQAEAAAEAVLAQAEYAILEQELILQTRQAFLEALLALNKKDLAEEAVELAGEAARIAALRLESGKSTPVESSRMTLEAARAKRRQEAAESEAKSAREALASLWSGESPGDFLLKGDLAGPLEVPSLEILLEQVDRAPEGALSEAGIEAARARRRIEEAARVPNVDLSVGIRRFEETGDSAFVAGVAVALPIFSRRSGQLEAASAELEAARLEAEALRRARLSALRRTYASVLIRKREVEMLSTTGLPAAEQALTVARAAFREGKSGYLDVLEAQHAYIELRVEQVEALAGFHAGLAEVERLSGFSLRPGTARDFKEQQERK